MSKITRWLHECCDETRVALAFVEGLKSIDTRPARHPEDSLTAWEARDLHKILPAADVLQRFSTTLRKALHEPAREEHVIVMVAMLHDGYRLRPGAVTDDYIAIMADLLKNPPQPEGSKVPLNFSPTAIGLAIYKALARDDPWPPSAGQFLHMCRAVQEDLHLAGFRMAQIEILRTMVHRTLPRSDSVPRLTSAAP